MIVSSSNKKRLLQHAVTALIITGFIAGSLDIVAACIQYYIRTGNGPGNVLRYIASGLFGKEAYAGGIAMAAWGLFFHYVIALGFTIFFFWIYSKINLGSKNKWITGILYGAFVWFVMNFVVIKLSNIFPPPSFDINKPIVAMLILIFCIGLPISLVISQYYSGKQICELLFV